MAPLPKHPDPPDGNTEFGFQWGPLAVERILSVDRPGGRWRALRLQTQREGIEVYVTPSGLLRVYELRSDGQRARRVLVGLRR